jgi:hypothetical protein
MRVNQDAATHTAKLPSSFETLVRKHVARREIRVVIGDGGVGVYQLAVVQGAI